MRRPAADAGAASVWVIGCCVLLLLVAYVGVLRAAAVLARHRAETAADLVALAAAGRIGVADDECGVAARAATANGARVLSCGPAVAADGRSGTVDVRVAMWVSLPVVGGRQVVATARAGRIPLPP